MVSSDNENTDPHGEYRTSGRTYVMAISVILVAISYLKVKPAKEGVGKKTINLDN